VKREFPIFVILGNPPYNKGSENKNPWILKLIEEYRQIEGVPLGERKDWLGDDYVKFIRLAEHYLERRGEGVVAYITPHGFIDNPTFRGMRYHLLKTFDEIYILNLHGNSRKRERGSTGEKDENLFPIQQGVSINFFLKLPRRRRKKGLGRVFYQEKWGSREEKLQFLKETSFEEVKWEEVPVRGESYYFLPVKEGEVALEREYLKGFSISELFQLKISGIVSRGDRFIIGFSCREILERIERFLKKRVECGRDYGGVQCGKRVWSVVIGE
jgi:predicted helicase